ncbi:hypothetical protein F4809DRAFT_654940 [Biscogniauxia mediterranea]|nr:hypothetical protein F4809DRAFT_654940 [Biscogniauxia mediterranea]
MASSQPEPTYTVFIRLPFPRGSFIDPPPVNWDSSKDEDLWSIVSRVSKTEIDWNEIAADFQVTVDFLLQQVAYLTERHASQVRAQMRKAAAAVKGPSAAPSPQLGAETPFTTDSMRRNGLGGGQPRPPSALTIRKDSPLPRSDGSIPGTPIRTTPRPSATRNSSSNTAVVTTARNLGGSGKAFMRPNSGADAQRHRLSSLPIATSVDDQDDDPDPQSPGPADSSSVASTSSSSSPAQSRIIRRPPRFQGSNDVPSSFADDEEDEEDAEPAFLPYRPPTDGSSSGQHDLSATLRGDPRDFGRRLGGGRERIHRSQTSDSSASSAAAHVSKGPSDRTRQQQPGNPLSPRRTMELVRGSPGSKNKAYSRDSDTPSMGSSFSDLDDASVTQSALEEALASNLMHQDNSTIGSLRTIGNAFRKPGRYLNRHQ